MEEAKSDASAEGEGLTIVSVGLLGGRLQIQPSIEEVAHDAGLGNGHAAKVAFGCKNCRYERGGGLIIALLGDVDLQVFLTDHRAYPLSSGSRAIYDAPVLNYEEEVCSIDPLDVRLSLTIDGETLTLRVDDDLQVAEARREN